MMKKLNLWMLAAILTISGTSLHAAGDETNGHAYFTKAELPDMTKILPPFPEFESARFVADQSQHLWGKLMRLDEERAAQAQRDAVYSNLPIGAMPDWEFKAQEADLAPGSTIFLYTDGLDEAENAQGQMFGKERIREVMQTSSQQPRALIESMTQAVADFVGDTEQSDDLTMLCIRRS